MSTVELFDGSAKAGTRQHNRCSNREMLLEIVSQLFNTHSHVLKKLQSARKLPIFIITSMGLRHYIIDVLRPTSSSNIRAI